MTEIAVIIPTFRPEIFFLDCLKALDNQTFDKSNFKIYICLNGPREPYEQKIRDWLESINFNFELSYTQEACVSHARNLLIDRSIEDFIVFIDDDDLVTPDYLEELFRVASVDAMGISNVIAWDPESGDYDTNFLGKSFDYIREKENSLLRARKYFSAPWAKIISRKMIGEVKFHEGLAVGEDALFMAQISKNVKCIVKTVPAAKYIVRLRSGSASRKFRGRIYELRRSFFTLLQYGVLLRHPAYNKIFILSRVAASLKNLVIRLS